MNKLQKPDLAELIASVADTQQKQRLSSFLQSNLSPCVAGRFAPELAPDALSSRTGGVPMLPAGTLHPCDRSGKAMHLLAQINFAELPNCGTDYPREGLFMLFWNAAHDRSNPKDRHAFRCIWLPQIVGSEFFPSDHSDCTIGQSRSISFSQNWSLPENEASWPEIDPAIRDKIVSYLKPDESKVQIFGQSGRNFDQLQEIAAFAGNGVSWSQARRNDSCYSHLVENASEWTLLLRITSIPELNHDLGRLGLFLLIRKEDLLQNQYDKSWLLFA